MCGLRRSNARKAAPCWEQQPEQVEPIAPVRPRTGWPSPRTAVTLRRAARIISSGRLSGMPARLALLLAALMGCCGGTDGSRPVPGGALAPANAASTVLWGPARFTVLSPLLLRLELAGEAGYDDRPSLAVINRDTSTPPFTVAILGDNETIQISTEGNVTLRYHNPGGNTSSSPDNRSGMCQRAFSADIQSPCSRSPAYPNGLLNTSQASCCAACVADAGCTAWIWATPGHEAPAGRDPAGTNCWPMATVGGINQNGTSSSRISGVTEVPWNAASLNVSFTVAGQPALWHPGLQDTANLGGAFHSLDCYGWPTDCVASYASSEKHGLLSRSGWFVLDDTAAARLTPPDSRSPSPLPFWYANASAAARPAADMYLFAHGHEYRRALSDYASIGGSPSLPPSSAYGVWWSHWEKYSQAQFDAEVLQGYRNHSLPLNHVMLDVDWHTQPTGNFTVPSYSYGGYTVETDLWPDWQGFIAALHNGLNPSGYGGLKLMLNLHPQGGTDAYNKYWPAFAAMIGHSTEISPGGSNYSKIVPCNWGNQTIAAASFTAFMDHAELADVDGWWTDFDYTDCLGAPTASTPSSWPGMAWSNEVFAGHQRVRGRRPLVLARSGGLGAHRNPVSFSGDTSQTQEILAWQINVTQRGANVLSAAWSHDVGGFMCGSAATCNPINKSDCRRVTQDMCSGDPHMWSNAVLYLRWIQAAVTFPIFRTHASEWGIPVMERRIWEFPANVSTLMGDAMRLRSALRPYLYSEARHAYDSGEAPVHPLWYAYPEEERAYSYTQQYAFGSVLLSSPVWAVNETARGPAGVTGSFKETWLPPASGGSGVWCDFNGSSCVDTSGSASGKIDRRFYGLGDIPLFAPAGAVLPMQTMASVQTVVADPLVLAVWPPAGQPLRFSASSFSLYEDDGNSNEFETGAFTRTVLTANHTGSGAKTGGSTVLTVAAPTGAGFAGAPDARALVVHFRGLAKLANPASLNVSLNGAQVLPGSAGCAAPCWYAVAEAAHTVVLPAGAVVVEVGRRATGAPTVVGFGW